MKLLLFLMVGWVGKNVEIAFLNVLSKVSLLVFFLTLILMVFLFQVLNLYIILFKNSYES